MYYYWWLITVLLYLGILSLYAVLTYLVKTPGERSGVGDSVFFAIASVVTLSIVPIVKENLYG